jgi:hypothetical protein
MLPTAYLMSLLVMATPPPEEPECISCAAVALSLLSRYEGRPADLSTIGELLNHADDCSLADLVTAGRALGLRLTAYRLAEGNRLPNRPFVAHIGAKDGGPPGHFVVLRPIDQRGRQYQWIDPPRYPRIVHETRLLHDPCFSRWILVASPWALWRTVAGWGVVVLGIGGVAWSVWNQAIRSNKRRTGRNAGSNGSHPSDTT